MNHIIALTWAFIVLLVVGVICYMDGYQTGQADVARAANLMMSMEEEEACMHDADGYRACCWEVTP